MSGDNGTDTSRTSISHLERKTAFFVRDFRVSVKCKTEEERKKSGRLAGNVTEQQVVKL